MGPGQWCIFGAIHYIFIRLSKAITEEIYINQMDEIICELTIKQQRLVNKEMLVLMQGGTRPCVVE